MKDKPSYKRGDIRIIQKKDFDEGKVLKGTEGTINFPMRVFENIKFILLNEENTVSIETTKKRFIWGQKPCDRDFDSSHSSHIELGEKIEYKEKEIQRKKEYEEYKESAREIFSILNSLPPPKVNVSSSSSQRRQQGTSYVNQDGVKKVRNSNSRTDDEYNNNPHPHFQQIYQTVAQQTMYEPSPNYSCRSSESSSRNESSSNDYSCSSSPSFD